MLLCIPKRGEQVESAAAQILLVKKSKSSQHGLCPSLGSIERV